MKTLEGEIDKNVCAIFDKTGCCPREDMCTKKHRQPEMSRCLIFHHLYPDPDLFVSSLPNPEIMTITEEQKLNMLNAFYLDMVIMLSQFGPLEDLVVASNKSDILSGNVLAMFREVDGAAAAFVALNNQYYAGRKIRMTFSPTLRLSSAICREDSNCKNGAVCPFIHPYHPSPSVYNDCFPRAPRQFPAKQREFKRTQFLNTPQNLLYGKLRTKDEFKQQT